MKTALIEIFRTNFFTEILYEFLWNLTKSQCTLQLMLSPLKRKKNLYSVFISLWKLRTLCVYIFKLMIDTSWFNTHECVYFFLPLNVYTKFVYFSCGSYFLHPFISTLSTDTTRSSNKQMRIIKSKEKKVVLHLWRN